jgi:DNA repair protein RecO (recombination protein O)
VASIKDQAVCIRNQDYSESSQIVTLFGREHGKIRAIAKGSRRTKGKFEGGIELLSVGSVIFVPAHEAGSLSTLSEFECTSAFPGLRKNLLGLHCAQYAADMISQFTEDFDPHELLFDALCNALAAFEQSQNPESVLLPFELTLLKEVGLAPMFDKCSSCGRSLDNNARLYFSSGMGGMLCRSCEPAVIEKRFIPTEILNILQHPDNCPLYNRKDVLEAHELLSYHQCEITGKQTSIMRFLNQLLKQHITAQTKREISH